MIYVWFTGINYYKLAVEKDRDSIFYDYTTTGPHSHMPLISSNCSSYFHCKGLNPRITYKPGHIVMLYQQLWKNLPIYDYAHKVYTLMTINILLVYVR